MPSVNYEQNLSLSDHIPGMEMEGYDWLMTEQPPTFLHATATPKPPPTPPPNDPFQGMPLNNTNYDFYQTNDLMAMTHQDILSAASILNNNISQAPMGQSQMSPPQMTHAHMPRQRMSVGGMGSTSGVLESIEHMHTPNTLPTASFMGTPTSQDVDAYNQPGRLVLGLNPLNTAQPLHYDGPHTAPPRMDNARMYRFGSDNHFMVSGFVPQNVAETHEYVQERLVDELRMLKPINRSNDVSRQQSPVQQSTANRSVVSQGQGSSGSGEDVHQDTKPLKRRRQDSEDESYGSKAKASARKVSLNPRLRRVSSAENGPKRRRSSLTGSAKQSRENLSEEQKRSNHIASEQKRRNLIKEGFDELNTLVPELRAGGLSKSGILNEAGTFLEQLIEINRMAAERMGRSNSMAGTNGG